MIHRAIFTLDTSRIQTNLSGFNNNKDLENSLGLSFNCAAKHFLTVEIYTDLKGLDIVKNVKNKPVNLIVHVVKFPYVNELSWSLSKIYIYSLQNEPFIHLDNDFYLWQFDHSIYKTTSKAFFIFQELEKPTIGNNAFELYVLGARYLGNLFPEDLHISAFAPNCGLFAISKIDIVTKALLTQYYYTAIQIAEKVPLNLYNNHPYFDTHFVSVVIEQSLIFSLLLHPDYKDYYNILYANEYNKYIKFTHLLGSKKRELGNIELVEYRLLNKEYNLF